MPDTNTRWFQRVTETSNALDLASEGYPFDSGNLNRLWFGSGLGVYTDYPPTLPPPNVQVFIQYTSA